MNSKQRKSYVSDRPVRFLFCLLLLCLFLSGCRQATDDTSEIIFTAKVVSLSEDTLLVRPDDNTKEDELCSQIYVPIDTQIVDSNGSLLETTDLRNAKHVQITYDGVLDNSDPALIENCYQILILE